MFSQFSTLPDLLDHFHDQGTCISYWESVRWPGGMRCAHCSAVEVYRTNRGFKCSAVGCGKKFSVLVGSIFENTKLPLRVWFAAMFILTTSKKGISAIQFSRQFNIGVKASWFLLHRIRSAYYQAAPLSLEGEIQVDETFVGGKNKNRHANKKIKHTQGRVFKDKTPVLGMMEPGGRVSCYAVADTSTVTLLPILISRIKKGSTVYTDEWHAYSTLYKYYKHRVVNHGRGEYKNGEATTNAIENFWSTFKKGIIGVYQWVSRRHLQNYINEFVFRFNHRNLSVADRFIAALRTAAGVRLTYKQLVG